MVILIWKKRFPIISSCFLSGTTARESYHNVLDWIDSVAELIQLPCMVFAKGLTMGKVKGSFHHLSIEESDKLVGELTVRMRFWGAECTQQGRSAGIVWRASSSGKGQLSLRAVVVGPFQD